MTNQYLIIGQGNIGLPLANAIAEQGLSVLTISRTKKNDQSSNITHLAIDARNISDIIDQLINITHIAIIVTPSHGMADRARAYQESYLGICQAIADIADALPNIRQVLFVSSTSVYGENAGEVIDESSIAYPNSPTAQILCDSENLLKHTFGNKAIIVRPSGIYGKHRQRMIRLANQAHIDGVPKSHFTNRIMDTDLVRVLLRIMMSKSPKQIYLATDFCPISSFEVMAFICQQLAMPMPIAIDTPRTGKQIVSNLPKDWLTFGDYKMGYAWILQK